MNVSTTDWSNGLSIWLKQSRVFMIWKNEREILCSLDKSLDLLQFVGPWSQIKWGNGILIFVIFVCFQLSSVLGNPSLPSRRSRLSVPQKMHPPELLLTTSSRPGCSSINAALTASIWGTWWSKRVWGWSTSASTYGAYAVAGMLWHPSSWQINTSCSYRARPAMACVTVCPLPPSVHCPRRVWDTPAPVAVSLLSPALGSLRLLTWHPVCHHCQQHPTSTSPQLGTPLHPPATSWSLTRSTYRTPSSHTTTSSLSHVTWWQVLHASPWLPVGSSDRHTWCMV